MSPIVIDVRPTIPWSSVCLSVMHVRALCSNGRRYRHDFFAYNSPMTIPDRVKDGLHPKILPQSDPPPPINLSVADIRSQIAAEWLQIAQWSQWRAYRKTTIPFSNGTIADATNSPSPKWGSHMSP